MNDFHTAHTELQKWLDLSSDNSYAVCHATRNGEPVYCIRLFHEARWDLPPKEFPLEHALHPSMKYLSDCIGYGNTLEAAIEEAFVFLPDSVLLKLITTK